MYMGYKVKVLMFAGRRKFMKINLPYLQEHPLVDEILICDNISNAADRDYILNSHNFYSKVRYVDQMKNYEEMHRANPMLSSLQYWNFYLNATDPSAVYLKFDDDIVYIGAGCIDNMLKRRFSDPEKLLIYATTVNNPLTNLLFDNVDLKSENLGEIMYQKFADSARAASMHKKFISDVSAFRLSDDFEFRSEYTFRLRNYGMNIRPSINAICWFGFDMRNWVSLKNKIRFIYDDEQFMCSDLFDIYDRPSIMIKDAVVSHYSFCTQHDLKKYESELLPQYAKLMGVDDYKYEQ